VSDPVISFANVSRFYGEVLGVNKVNLNIPSGITSLVGPNGSGKTTLMNLMTGLIRPTQGEIKVLGIAPEHPEQLCKFVGYCTQFDSCPKGLTPKASPAINSSTGFCACTDSPRRSATAGPVPRSSASA
jgi:ABC-2 type transport system ATP-binding protein